ncbi:MAG: hypothetical protein QW273_02120 [Candidatus Pacearchaeota archaeon]
MKNKIKNKKTYFVLLISLLIISAFVFAYNPSFNKRVDEGGGSYFGHSADEIVIRKTDGSLVTLQEIINDLNSISSSQQSLSQEECYWTDWFRVESGNSPQYAPVGYYIAGIDYKATSGGNDGAIRFYYCKGKEMSSPYYVGCPVDNIVENGKKYGKAMGFNDEGGGNDFYICCRDKKVIFFGYGGRSYTGWKCDEFGNTGSNAVGVSLS